MPSSSDSGWGSKLGSAGFFHGVVAVLRLVNRLWFGLKVVGREHLTAHSDGVITVSNHVAALDSSMVAGVHLGRRFAFTALPANFRLPVAGFFVRHLGCIPVPRRGDDDDRARFAADVADRVQRDWAVHFFPEGELVPYCEEVREFRHGAFTLACQLNVPVIPMVITWRPAGPIRRLLRRRPRALLTVCPPEYPGGKSHEDALELLARCRAAMLA